MRITLVGPAYPYRGGIAHFAASLQRALLACGHGVDVVTFRRQYPAVLFPGETQYEEAGEPPFPVARTLDSVGPLSWFRTAYAIAERSPDVVVFQHWMPFFAPAFGTVARLLRRQNTPSLVLVHNALPHERRPGDRLLSRYFFGACQGFLVMSERVEQDLASLGVAGPVHRAAHPIYDHFGGAVPRAEASALLGLPAEAPVLLFFGFVRRYKGLHVLLDAMPHIAEALPDVHLVVAGEFYDDAAPYRAQIERHRLGGRVHLHDRYIPTEHVAHFFSAADLVVQPYVSATQSGVAQIAMHFERPLVVTDVGGLAEVVPHGEAGLVVPPEDAEALADAVVRFFRERMSERLTAGVHRQKARFGWGALAEAVEALARASGVPR